MTSLLDRLRGNAKVHVHSLCGIAHLDFNTPYVHGYEQYLRTVLDVPRRTAILFHAGNTHQDTHGCILVGRSVHGEKVSESRDAIELMRRTIGEKDFDLQITDAPEA